MRKPLLFLALPLFASCVIEDGATPSVGLDMRYVSAEVHRGMLQADHGVLIPSTVIVLPAREDGAIIIKTEGSMDLSDDNGSAWRPDGHSGRLARFDWSVLYEQALEDVLLTFGLVNYNLPNGREFAFGERGATSEVMFEVLTEVGGVTPRFRASYDVDEVEGLYLEAGVGKEFELREDLNLGLDLGLGWMDEEQAFWQYGQTPATDGLADLRLTAELSYALDAHTTAVFEIGYSEVLADDFKTWFDLLGVDPRQEWVGVGVSWSY